MAVVFQDRFTVYKESGEVPVPAWTPKASSGRFLSSTCKLELPVGIIIDFLCLWLLKFTPSEFSRAHAIVVLF